MFLSFLCARLHNTENLHFKTPYNKSVMADASGPFQPHCVVAGNARSLSVAHRVEFICIWISETLQKRQTLIAFTTTLLTFTSE